MFKKTGFSILIWLLLVITCSDKTTPPDPVKPNLNAAEKQVIEASNQFAFDIFNEVLETEADKNIFISPLSISYALGMTYNGANGETEEAMRNVLAYGDMTNDKINESYSNLTDVLTTLDPKVLFEIANSIWYRNTFNVEEDFLNLNRDYFDAEVSALDFTDPSACVTINDWVKEKTHDKIKKVLDPPIPPELVMFLINAIYFKGTWTYEFDKDDTYKGEFILSDGKIAEVDMMTQKMEFPYFENDYFQMVDLPYGEAGFCMAVLLPKFDKSLDDVVGMLNTENWDNWMESLESDTVHLSLPKFRFRNDLRLNDALTNLGMGIAFDHFMADFSGINKTAQLYIDFVQHLTFVQVDEEGTEASAVTVVGIGFTSINDDIYMIINRPFLFVIHDNYTGSILFMSKVVQPVWED